MPARNALRLHIARPLAVKPSTPNRSLIPDKIPNASECESQFRIRPRPDLVDNDIRGLELIKRLRAPSLHLVQQAEVAQRVPFESSIAHFPCHGESCFVIRAGFVHDSQFSVCITQIAEYVALPMPVPRPPG